MSGDTRLERQLPLILADLGAGPAPDYTETLVARTAATAQRPGWTFIEWWLPMSALTERMATTPRVPLRALAAVAILILALVAAALYVGSQQRRLPAPFGPAGNGLIAYSSGGDILVGDPVTGDPRLLVGGPAEDSGPGFSPDGTRLAFFRESDLSGPRDIYVVNEDGSHLVRVTPEPVPQQAWANWAPDGRMAVIQSGSAGMNQFDLYDTTGNGSVQMVASAAGMDFVQFRPPDGREFLYRALVDGKWGLFAMKVDGSTMRTIVEPTVDAKIDMTYSRVTWSADGSRIFYNRGAADGCCQPWVVNADGSDPHEFVPPGVDSWIGEAVVSPDGTWVAYWHSPNDGQTFGLSVVRADGTGPVIETGPEQPGGAHWTWAPDSSKILMYPDDVSSSYAYLLDPEGGPWTRVPWQSGGDLDWQRVAAD